jgi:hypothetical protein
MPYEWPNFYCPLKMFPVYLAGSAGRGLSESAAAQYTYIVVSNLALSESE